MGIKGLPVRDLQESLCCALEQDTFIRCLVLVQSRKTGNGPDRTKNC